MVTSLKNFHFVSSSSLKCAENISREPSAHDGIVLWPFVLLLAKAFIPRWPNVLRTGRQIERSELRTWLGSFAVFSGKTIYSYSTIPANFFWDMRFLSWKCWNFWRRHDHVRRFPKKCEVFRRIPKTSEVPVPVLGNLRTHINASSLPVLFTSIIRDREEVIVIFSFYTWFSFLTWVWVNVFLEIVSSKMATTHIFQSGVRNWPAGVSRREMEVFNPLAWDSRPRRESWQVYSTSLYPSVWMSTDRIKCRGRCSEISCQSGTERFQSRCQQRHPKLC